MSVSSGGNETVKERILLQIQLIVPGFCVCANVSQAECIHRFLMTALFVLIANETMVSGVSVSI